MKNYNKILLFLSLFIVCLLNNQIFAIGNNAELKLKKLSLVLRGKQPTAEEYFQANESFESGNLNQYLNIKADEYLKSSDFAMKFTNKFSDTIRMNQTSVYFDTKMNYVKNDDISIINQNKKFENFNSAFHLLVREIFETNAPWSDILNRKSYYLMYEDANIDFELDQISFYGSLNPAITKMNESTLANLGMLEVDSSLKKDRFSSLQINFPNEDKRIAGILTTPSFLIRYPTTITNRNRARAAAIFRTFLCKDMIAAIPVSKEGDDQNKKLALVGQGFYSETDIINHIKMNDIHGSNVDCQQCHKQLDPMGNLFNLTPKKLNQKYSIGELNYINEDGDLINKTIDGIGNLGNVLLGEKDYYSCQVKHFWRWVYGDNSLMSPSQELELIQKFKDLNQKPQDFIKHLVLKNDFFNTPVYSESQLSAIGAFKTLKKCQSCHNQQTENVSVQFLNWYQIINDSAHSDRKYWINKISTQLNKDSMPPTNSRKDFSESELKNLKKWLMLGSPNFEGHK